MKTAFATMVFTCGLTFAADPFPATPLRIADGNAPLSEVLVAFEKTLGMPIDRNGISGLDRLSTGRSATAWAVLNERLEPNGLTLLPTGKGDRLKLVKKADANSVWASDAGPFRVVFKNVSSRFDVESNSRTTEVALILHWEPRLAVFRVGGLTGMSGITADGSKANVVANLHPLNLKMISKRSDRMVDLSGQVTVTAAEKRLRFTFKNLPGRREEQTMETVSVSLARFERKDDLMEAEIALAYPVGMPVFESFEEECWLRDNLARVVSPNRMTQSESTDFQVRVTPRGAVIVYRFPINEKKGMVPGPGWTLEIETPSPLKEFAIPFTLKGIPLP